MPEQDQTTPPEEKTTLLTRRKFLQVAALTLGLSFPSYLTPPSVLATETTQQLFLPDQKGEEDGDLSQGRTIFLTFDDGYIGLREKIAALNALNVHGTFFLTGEVIEKHAKLIEWLVKSGHSLRNHTYSHPNLTLLSSSAIAKELILCDRAARKITGVSTKPHMRPPYGAINRSVRQVAEQLGYKPTLWDWDTRDWSGNSAFAIEENIKPGIVLMHTQGQNTIRALAEVIPILASRGYKFGIF